mgnify:CR=1 FL=1
MNIPLIQGEFSSMDAMELIAQMMLIKIKYHENKINNDSSEEDIKRREAKIKQLQNDLYELRKMILSKNTTIKVESIIKIE